MRKYYLIWLDILGFKVLVEKIARDVHVEERKVRTDFINVIKEKIDTAETRGEIVGKNFGERDDWILVTDSLDLAFKVIYKILDHNTGYKDYQGIPMEIAIGIGEYDRWARFDGPYLIIENSTVNYLKTKIIDYYHEWHRLNMDESPRSTFIAITESAYSDLERLDKKMCKKISYHPKHVLEKDELTFYVADVDKVKQRGKMLVFLEKIGKPGSKLYDRIDSLYVPPTEYSEMIKTLKTNQLVFITGTSEYGKTYTAIRLLWEFFTRGYEPVWREAGESSERQVVRIRLLEIERELKPKHIVYFEDPFGKTQYERRENLEREIGAIIDCIHNTEDAYVIITSREEVFKEFDKEKISLTAIRDFEKKLNIKKPSYNYSRRREILLKWAEARNCAWFNDSSLRDFLTDKLEDERVLPTPLSIRDFVLSTIKTKELETLKEKIKEKSKETAIGFAEEIESMSYDKILFLSFLFIHAFNADFIREEYTRLLKELDIKEPCDFESVFQWFEDDKIMINSQGGIEFSHPSYCEALEYLLVKQGMPTYVNKNVFCKVLLVLARRSKAARYAAYAIQENFDKLPKTTRVELLLKLSQTKEAASVVVEIVNERFSLLSRDVRDDLLLTLVKWNESAHGVMRVVKKNFDSIPEDVRNKLLIELSNPTGAPMDVARMIMFNFDDFSESLRSELLPRLLRSNITDQLAWAVAYNFAYLSERARNELLLKLAEKDEAAWFVGWTVANYFDELPKELRNEILSKLSKNSAAHSLRKILSPLFPLFL